jgi:hypothetical protein
MDVLDRACAGLDVHKVSVVACRVRVDGAGRKHKVVVFQVWYSPSKVPKNQ